MRNNKKFDGKVDRRPPLPGKSIQQILAQLENVVTRLPGKHEKYGSKKCNRHPTKLNWMKKSILWELPYWSSFSLRHILDVMHI